MEKTVRTMLEANHLVLLLIIISLIGFEFVQSTCSRACSSCTNDTCVTCNVGSFLESGSCHNCPEHCTFCYNSGACYTCFEGYFGLSCEKQCHDMCFNKACYKDNGTCSYGCREGYFESGTLCSKCNVNCKTCTQTSINCLECKEGNYGPACQYACSHCTDGICTRDNCTYGCVDGFLLGREACISCSDRCISCSDTPDNCHSCVDEHYGPACQLLCNECSPCSKEDGSCLTTRKVYPPTITIQMASPSKESKSSVLTTRIFTTTFTNTSQSAISTDSRIQIQNQEDSSLNKGTIISAAAGGVGGLVIIVIVVIIVILCKRRSETKQTNERVCQVGELDTVSQDYTTLSIEIGEEDGHTYSSLNKADTKVTMETRSTTRDASGRETHHDMQHTNIAGRGHGSYVNVIDWDVKTSHGQSTVMQTKLSA